MVYNVIVSCIPALMWSVDDSAFKLCMHSLWKLSAFIV